MIRTGFIGDLINLRPIFEGFDEKELVDMDENSLDADEQSKVDNAVVPNVPDLNKKFIKSVKSPDASNMRPTDAGIGAAGNSLVADETEPQLGSIGGLGGLKLTEGVENSVIDDTGMKMAEKATMQNSMEKAKGFFEQFHGMRAIKNPKFDVDTTNVKTTVSSEPIRRIPRGW